MEAIDGAAERVIEGAAERVIEGAAERVIEGAAERVIEGAVSFDLFCCFSLFSLGKAPVSSTASFDLE